MSENEDGRDSEPTRRKRKSGIPTGHAGEYFVMGELLRRGFDAQLADRNTKGYDILIGRPGANEFRPVQVKTVRMQPWYVRQADFQSSMLDRLTIYVLLGQEQATKPVRFFITRNRDVAAGVHRPATFQNNAFLALKAVQDFEDRWDLLDESRLAPSA